MSKIDTTGWREFKLSDLFDICLSHTDWQKNNFEEGDIPLVSSGKTNNGIVSFVKKNSYGEMFPGGSITIDMFGQPFFQKEDFYAVSHGRINILKPKLRINEEALLCITSILATTLNGKYDYSKMCTSQKLMNETILLPAKEEYEPDWEYMENYMKSVMEETEEYIKIVGGFSNNPKYIDASGWSEFKIGNLFDVSRPSARSSQNYDEGDMPFVASGNFNNGVTAYLQPKNDNDYDKGDCITVSAVDGYAFYQKDNFLGRGGAGSSIMMLRNDNLNELNGKYICTLIRKACNDWEYSNMGNKDKLADTMIWLPITSTGEPDWQYMEDYMRNIMEESESVIKQLNI